MFYHKYAISVQVSFGSALRTYRLIFTGSSIVNNISEWKYLGNPYRSLIIQKNAEITYIKAPFQKFTKDPIIQMNAYYFPYSNIILPMERFNNLRRIMWISMKNLYLLFSFERKRFCGDYHWFILSEFSCKHRLNWNKTYTIVTRYSLKLSSGYVKPSFKINIVYVTRDIIMNLLISHSF